MNINDKIVELAAEVGSYINQTNRPVFASRADFEAATVPANRSAAAFVENGLTLEVVRDDEGTVATTPDGQNWSPAGTVRPEHWQENTVPGETYMTSAILSMCDFMAGSGGTAELIGEVYLFDQTVNKIDVNGFTLKGSKCGRSEIFAKTPGTGETLIHRGVGGSVENVKISGFSFVRAGAGSDLTFHKSEITNEYNWPPVYLERNGNTEVDLTNNRVLVNDTEYQNGDVIQYKVNGGTAIGGLTENGLYYVVDWTIAGFSLSLTEGGEVIDLTAAGVGDHNFDKYIRSGYSPRDDADIQGLDFTNNKVHHVVLGLFTASSYGNDGSRIRNYRVNRNLVWMTTKVGMVFNSDPLDGGVSDAWQDGEHHNNRFWDYWGGPEHRSSALGFESVLNASVRGNVSRGYGVDVGLSGDLCTATEAIHIEGYCDNMTVAHNKLLDCDRAIGHYPHTGNVMIVSNLGEGRKGRTLDTASPPSWLDAVPSSSGSNGVYAILDSSGSTNSTIVASNIMRNFDFGYVSPSNGYVNVVDGNLASLCTVAYMVHSGSLVSRASGTNTAEICKYVCGAYATGVLADFGKVVAVNCYDLIDKAAFDSTDGMVILRDVAWSYLSSELSGGALSTSSTISLPTGFSGKLSVSTVRQGSKANSRYELLSLVVDGNTVTATTLLAVGNEFPATYLNDDPLYTDAGNLELRLFNSGGSAPCSVNMSFDGELVYQSD